MQPGKQPWASVDHGRNKGHSPGSSSGSLGTWMPPPHTPSGTRAQQSGLLGDHEEHRCDVTLEARGSPVGSVQGAVFGVPGQEESREVSFWRNGVTLAEGRPQQKPGDWVDGRVLGTPRMGAQGLGDLTVRLFPTPPCLHLSFCLSPAPPPALASPLTRVGTRQVTE